MTTPLNSAIERIEGGQVALAAACNVSPQAVNQWVKSGRIPPKHVLTAERLSGVSRHELLPEVFGEKPTTPQNARVKRRGRNGSRVGR